MEIVVGTQQELGQARLLQMDRYRYRVFVDTLGWELACDPGRERDQFDHDETLYVLACNDQEQVIGTARVLPTNQRYLLAEVFPQLMGDQTLPCDSRIWELSRFSAMDFGLAGRTSGGQFSSVVAPQLLDAVLRCAAARGVRQLITVSPLGIERLLRRAGYRARRAAAPVRVGDQWLFACWIDVPTQACTIGEVTDAADYRSIHRAA